MTSKREEQLPFCGRISHNRGQESDYEISGNELDGDDSSECKDSNEVNSLQESFENYDDESEYEYIDEDDEGQEKRKEEEEACSSSLPTKRKAASGAQWLHSPKGGCSLQHQCLSVSSATNRRGFNTQGQTNCPMCNQENHAPLVSCKIASEWTAGNISESISSSGITTWPSEYVMPCISFRIHECATAWNLPEEQVSLHLQRHGFNITAASINLSGEIQHNNDGRTAQELEQELVAAHCQRHEQFMEKTSLESKPPAASKSDGKRVVILPPEGSSKTNESSLIPTSKADAKPLKASSKAATLGVCEKVCGKLCSCFRFCPVSTRGTSETVTEASTQITKESVIKITCGICMEDFEPDELFSLGCGHLYCSECWHNYLQTCFEGNFAGHRALLVECPDPQCTELVGKSHIRNIAPSLLPRFEEHCLAAFVRANPTVMRWCPGAGCNRIAITTDILFAGQDGCQGITAVCGGKGGCQTRFCFHCGGEPHSGFCPVDRPEGEALPPAVLLQQAQHQVRAPLGGNGINNVERIQLCPRCKSPIEKNGGCNYMTCKCGCKFCWLCNADITKEGYSHHCGRSYNNRWPGRRRTDRNEAKATRPRIANLEYIHDALEWTESKETSQGKSNPPKSVATNEETKHIPQTRKTTTQAMVRSIVSKQEEMRNISHFYNRFMAHNQGQEFAMGETRCVSDRADEFNKLSGIKSAMNRDFLAEANAILVLSRRVLKYSYCYAYQETIKSLDSVNVALSETKLDGKPSARDRGNDENLRLSLFQHHQERLERYTEELSEVSERAFSLIDRKRVLDLMEVVSRSMKVVINFEVDNQ